MGLWQAQEKIYVEGVLLEGGGIISLTDEQEKQLKLGKYAAEVPDARALRMDPNSKKKVKVGLKGLVRISKSDLAGREGKEIEEGFILYPPQKDIMRGDSRSEAHPTIFQEMR